MTEPVLINRSILIALMVVVQTLTAPLVALASLFIVMQIWPQSLEHSPSTLAVVIVLQFLVLTHPPRDLSEQLAWRPLAASIGATTFSELSPNSGGELQAIAAAPARK